MNALTPITPQSPCVDFEYDIHLCDFDSGLEWSGTAGFNIEVTNLGGYYFNRDLEYTASLVWFHVGRLLLGRKDLVAMFGAETIEEAESLASRHYTETYA